jgi:hypothetical protein
VAPASLSGRFHPQFCDKNRRDIGKISANMARIQDGNARLTVLRAAIEPKLREGPVCTRG